jgi:hypothetical protein
MGPEAEAEAEAVEVQGRREIPICCWLCGSESMNYERVNA